MAGQGRGPVGLLYEWVLRFGSHRHAEPALAAVSFAESSVFPIAPDVMLFPMVLARPRRWWRTAAVATTFSVAGGFLGYAIGWGLWEMAGQVIIDSYGLSEAFSRFETGYQENGAWIILLASLTPFPYKAVTIASGAVGLDIVVFGLISLAGRGIRFFTVSGAIALLGERVEALVRRHARLVGALFFVALGGGFVLLAVT